MLLMYFPIKPTNTYIRPIKIYIERMKTCIKPTKTYVKHILKNYTKPCKNYEKPVKNYVKPMVGAPRWQQDEGQTVPADLGRCCNGEALRSLATEQLPARHQKA